MLPYSWYLLKVMICSGILFGYYWLFLRNKLFHQYNRFYLLMAMGLSLLLPLLKINFWDHGAENNQAIRMLQAVSVGDEYMNNIVVTSTKNNWNFEQLYLLIYWLISLVFLIVLLRTVYIILKLLKQYPVQQVEAFSFVNTNDDSTPFSFLNYIFWNDGIDMDTTTGKQIFKHEIAHIQEKHTYDKLFVNITLIFFWCNPFFWLYRKELNMIHEFIADKKAVEDSDTAAFAAMILQATYPQHRFELTNNFFYSPIKRRLLMLTKIDNPRVSYFARVMVLPLAILVFAAFTFKAKNNGSIYHGKKITVVINAGHGGKDNGATGINGVLEKDINFELAKRIKELNDNSAIEVVLTKTNDIFMSKEEVVEFVKAQNASLYISLHTNLGSADKSGMEVFVPKEGFSFSSQSRLLGSAIANEFSQNYPLPVSPQLTEKHFWSLEKNSCPSVIVEAGLISNQKDLDYLQSEKGKNTIAKNILAAIERFANSAEKKLDLKPVMIKHDTVPQVKLDNALSIQGKQPLYFLDGKEIDSSVMHKVDPNKIESINILKDKSAIEKYGKNATNGVVEIILKKNTDIQKETIPVAIALDKMNMLYIGLENPVTIAAANIPADKLLVSIDQGRITGDNGRYNVHVIHAGVANIEVATIKNNQRVVLGTQTFRVRLLPNPDGTEISPDYETNLKIDDSYNSKLKLQQEQQVNMQLRLAEKTVDGKKLTHQEMANVKLKLASIEDQKRAEQDLTARTVQGRKMTDQEMAALKQKIQLEQLNKVKFDDLAEITIQERKMTDQEIAALKQKIQLEQLNKAKADGLAAKTIEGKKIQEQEIQSLKLKPASVEQEKKAEQDLAERMVVGRKMTNQEMAVLNEKMQLEQQEKAKAQNNKVFIKMEKAPQFTGGDEAWLKYLRANLKADVPIDEHWKAGKYTVIVKFIVHTDGTVSDVTTENYKGSKTAAECIRVIKNAPDWQPAMQNGIRVNAYHKQPITFVVEE